jgi:hypothetical protein
VDSRRVRFVFFLIPLIVCAQFVEVFALISLGDSMPAKPSQPEPFEIARFAEGMVFTFAPLIGPPIVFALMSLLTFRPYYWGLWCLTFFASMYALFILMGLLVEYGMAREATAAAARGSRYMNCAGHPRLFFFVIGLPTALGMILLSTFVVVIELAVRAAVTGANHSVSAKS